MSLFDHFTTEVKLNFPISDCFDCRKVSIVKLFSTFLMTDIADDMSTGGDSQFSVSTGAKEAGVAADPVRHLKTCNKKIK